MGTCYWIWYPGDMELYYAMKQNFSRVERGYGWPAFWKSDGFRNRVVFRRTYMLEHETSFSVESNSAGFCLVKGAEWEKKYVFGRRIDCGPGEVSISVHAGCIEEFPSIYIDGDVIYSDDGWQVWDYASAPVHAGYCKYFTKKQQNPAKWEYSEKVYQPIRIEDIGHRKDIGHGVLYEFETELTAVFTVVWKDKISRPVTVCCGESREEALDQEHCYYSWQTDPETGKTPRSAFRYVFVPGVSSDELDVYAVHQFVDISIRARFHCNDQQMNRIWSVAAHTFALCSGIFFIDGVKRDKWIWSGDAYQSLFVNQYLMADPDINRRTLLALRGNDPVITHINTIVDYSLYWILGVKAHFDAYADLEFVRQVYPKMCSLLEFCEKQEDEHGFLIGRPQDWIFIDWADFDREGPLCALQMLYAACFKAMGEAAGVLNEGTAGASAERKAGELAERAAGELAERKAGALAERAAGELAERKIGASAERKAGALDERKPEDLRRDAAVFEERYQQLKKKIAEFYWDDHKGAFVDSFVSGRRHVTRHANIFAVLFDIADDRMQQAIAANVLHNPKVPEITTPYFKFYELDALGKLGFLKDVYHQVKSYWGGMLDAGAVTFWEEYDPKASKEEQYDMYGDKFGKSLCHAWAASPVYLLAKYFAGLQILDPKSGAYEVHVCREVFSELDCTFPVGEQDVHVELADGRQTVEARSRAE